MLIEHTAYSLVFLNFNNLTLKIAIQFDPLAKIMVSFILVIGFFIYRYAKNYLESDTTRLRFLLQLILVLLSVLLLVLSENLFTAFVAWQFIGINLYVLLNHYHHDPLANRAAKKKFVINRIGDCSFLVAIILALHSHSDNSFSSIQVSPHAELICLLLFISIMTKCAQFPFHIWLIDTMETPTPVSALMHAGVINAGGILLTRVSGTLVHFQVLLVFILFLGLTSAALSLHWMMQQPDTKKKLAYSTMGQMGYMLIQCSLGAFPAAIFHLISHGFYKASLFLNAGETLHNKTDTRPQAVNNMKIIQAILITFIIFALGIWIFKYTHSHIPFLMYGFIFITLISMVLKIILLQNFNRKTKTICFAFISLIFFAYLELFQVFSHLLSQYEYVAATSLGIQIIIFTVVFICQLLFWKGNLDFASESIKDRTELFFRKYILNPLRAFGNIINNPTNRHLESFIYFTVLAVTSLSFLYGIYQSTLATQLNTEFYKFTIFIFLVISVASLIFANRCLSIKPLITYLILFELAFTNIAFFDGNSNISKIGVFHAINISLVLLMLILLARNNSTKKQITISSNRLPTRVFYLVFSLLLLIGVPGTASFISEFYLLSTLMGTNIIFILIYICIIILIAVVIMHSLQLYAFNKKYSVLFLKPITRREHLIFLIIIGINFISGLFPELILSHI